MKKKSKLVLLLILIAAVFLRLWRINEVPISLFGDELDVGYHAYSILKTGKDYLGNPWPLHFQSFGEYRTPLYLYSAVPTVAAFGISPLGVRLPAVFFGVLGILAFYLLVKELTKNEVLALISAAVLTFSPWHIQYSRAAFEATQLLFFLLLGIYLFLKGLKDGRWLWVSAFCLGLTPWVYNTAKLFTPLLVLFLILVWGKQLLSLSKKHLLWAMAALLIVGLPMVHTIFLGEKGAQRYKAISILTDPVTESEVDYARFSDARARGETGLGLTPTFADKFFHNKITFWGSNILQNYFKSFSADFLFVRGDINLRHSIEEMGQFYKIEVTALVLGLIFFFTKFKDKKMRSLMTFWILVGALPAAITREGGGHATRLILILPPLIFLIAYGLVFTFNTLNKKQRLVFGLAYLVLFILGFAFYQHKYWLHNPRFSERWWDFGYKEVIQSIKELENDYDKIIISTASEQPPWKYFAAWYQYPPEKWQQGLEEINIKGFGEMLYIDKYYFGQIKEDGIYSLAKAIDKKTIYVATDEEMGFDLEKEPERIPKELALVKTISYPSGQPAFYLFIKK